MKAGLLAGIAALFAAAPAMATPVVGDYALFEVRISGVFNHYASEEFVEFNQDRQEFKLELKYMNAAHELLHSASKWIGSDQINTEAMIDAVLENCPSALEKITILNGQVVDACAFEQAAQDPSITHQKLWIGTVPFGIVKRERETLSNGATVH